MSSENKQPEYVIQRTQVGEKVVGQLVLRGLTGGEVPDADVVYVFDQTYSMANWQRGSGHQGHNPRGDKHRQEAVQHLAQVLPNYKAAITGFGSRAIMMGCNTKQTIEAEAVGRWMDYDICGTLMHKMIEAAIMGIQALDPQNIVLVLSTDGHTQVQGWSDERDYAEATRMFNEFLAQNPELEITIYLLGIGPDHDDRALSGIVQEVGPDRVHYVHCDDGQGQQEEFRGFYQLVLDGANDITGHQVRIEMAESTHTVRLCDGVGAVSLTEEQLRMAEAAGLACVIDGTEVQVLTFEEMDQDVALNLLMDQAEQQLRHLLQNIYHADRAVVQDLQNNMTEFTQQWNEIILKYLRRNRHNSPRATQIFKQLHEAKSCLATLNAGQALSTDVRRRILQQGTSKLNRAADRLLKKARENLLQWSKDQVDQLEELDAAQEGRCFLTLCEGAELLPHDCLVYCGYIENKDRYLAAAADTPERAVGPWVNYCVCPEPISCRTLLTLLESGTQIKAPHGLMINCIVGFVPGAPQVANCFRQTIASHLTTGHFVFADGGFNHLLALLQVPCSLMLQTPTEFHRKMAQNMVLAIRELVQQNLEGILELIPRFMQEPTSAQVKQEMLPLVLHMLQGTIPDKEFWRTYFLFLFREHFLRLFKHDLPQADAMIKLLTHGLQEDPVEVFTLTLEEADVMAQEALPFDGGLSFELMETPVDPDKFKTVVITESTGFREFSHQCQQLLGRQAVVTTQPVDEPVRGAAFFQVLEGLLRDIRLRQILNACQHLNIDLHDDPMEALTYLLHGDNTNINAPKYLHGLMVKALKKLPNSMFRDGGQEWVQAEPVQVLNAAFQEVDQKIRAELEEMERQRVASLMALVHRAKLQLNHMGLPKVFSEAAARTLGLELSRNPTNGQLTGMAKNTCGHSTCDKFLVDLGEHGLQVHLQEVFGDGLQRRNTVFCADFHATAKQVLQGNPSDFPTFKAQLVRALDDRLPTQPHMRAIYENHYFEEVWDQFHNTLTGDQLQAMREKHTVTENQLLEHVMAMLDLSEPTDEIQGMVHAELA